jgi:hypothetical protein
MVHYDPNSLKTVQTPPPVCPRCGSHRTEIVGLSDDGRTMTLRCNACGERSRIEMAHAALGARAAVRGDEDAAEELAVMRIVGRALAQLPDSQSRMRVLRWATERFRPVATADVRTLPPVPAPSRRSGDQALSVEGMEALFADVPEAREPVAPVRPAAPEKLESLVEGFVSDFQRVALEWQAV